MRLTPLQINDLMKVLDRYTWTFLAYHVGVDILSDDQKRYLQNIGVSVNDIARTAYNVEHAFKFGILSDVLGDPAAKKMNYDQLKQYLESGKSFALTKVEQNALASLKFQASDEVIKFADKIKSGIKNELVHADLKRNTVRHSQLVLDGARKAIEDRRYVKDISSYIGKARGQWDKDFDRISDYVLHQAFDEGRAAASVRIGGDDALVYKDVYAGACKHCVKLYLKGGVGSEPIVFKVSQLKANGTNVGRKANDWKAVIGALHPWCRCTLNSVPDGFSVKDLEDGKWEWSGFMFRRVKSAEPRRERPKATVQIGNKIVKV